jgi:DNA polymerase III gamma/tau subunit
MSDDVLHNGPTAAPVEVAQPSKEGTSNEVLADGTGAPAQEQESEEAKAERIVQERKVRQERSRRNQEAAFARLASKNDELTQALMEAVKRGNPQQAQPTAPDKAPAREDYQSWEDYEDARLDWKYEQKTKAKEASAAQDLQRIIAEAQRHEANQRLSHSHAERVQDFASRVPDFEDVTNRDDITVPDGAATAIQHAPNGPEIIYELGRNPEIAARLNRMNGVEQALFVGQLSAALMSRVSQVSKAPAPGNPVGSRSSPATSLEAATNYDDFVRLRRKQIAARR